MRLEQLPGRSRSARALAKPLAAQPLHRPAAKALLEGVLQRAAAVMAALLHIGQADWLIEMGQEPFHQGGMHKGLLFTNRCWRNGLQKVGNQQHHNQSTDEVVEPKDRIHLASDGHRLFGKSEGFHQEALAAVAAGIVAAIEDRRLLQGASQGQPIESWARNGMGHGKQGFRGKLKMTPEQSA
jgi:hypothetical protein